MNLPATPAKRITTALSAAACALLIALPAAAQDAPAEPVAPTAETPAAVKVALGKAGPTTFSEELDVVAPVLPESASLMVPMRGAGVVDMRTRGSGLMTVCIPSAEGFSPAEVIDPSTLTFGAEGDERSVQGCNAADMNRDGKKDLVCRVRLSETGFDARSSVATMAGVTDDGRDFELTTAVRVTAEVRR